MDSLLSAGLSTVKIESDTLYKQCNITFSKHHELQRS